MKENNDSSVVVFQWSIINFSSTTKKSVGNNVDDFKKIILH